MGQAFRMAAPSGTVTLLFTDIEGSTRLWEEHPEAMAIALKRHDELIRSAVESTGGYVFKTIGDAFCAVFASARNALAATGVAQTALRAEIWPEGICLRVRMALHTGKCEERDGDYFGPTVNRTARLKATAHGGQVVLSQATAQLVGDPLPERMGLIDLGSHRLKDLGRPEHVFGLHIEGLTEDFPPLQSLDNPALPNNLPAQSASFVGRVREVNEVRNLVEVNRLVTLTGAGGSGKTRLALQVAAELLDGSGDGVWLVELAAVSDQNLVAAMMSSALGVTSQPGQSEFDTLLAALEPQRTLIVLDNCEHLIGACAKVADAILRGCPAVHVMATSREPLGIAGEIIYRVPSLSLPDDPVAITQGESDAVALFVDRARSQGINVPLDEVAGPLLASICRRLDGMPLAIELAAGRLRSMSVPSLHDRLDQRFRLLTGGSRSALPRQQTLRATVDWSYSLLTELEKSLFRRLSVFPDGFDLEAAEAVCPQGDIDVSDIADLLGSLVDKSLVVADQVGSGIRYRLLETIRQFGAEHLVENDVVEAEAVAVAHCEHFLSLAEQIDRQLTWSQRGAGFSRLDADYANLLRSIERAVTDPKGTGLALRFAIALHRYAWARHRANEAMALIVPVFDRPDASIDAELLGQALVSVLNCRGSMDHPTAQRLGERAVAMARDVGDDRLLAKALAALSMELSMGGHSDRSLPLAEEAVERARAVDDDGVLCIALAAHLEAYSLGEPMGTDLSYDEALEAAERAGDLILIGMLNNNAGCRALQLAAIPDARRYFQRAEWAFGVIADDQTHTMTNLGWVAREEGDLREANLRFTESMRVNRRSGDGTDIAYALLGIACVAGDEAAWRTSVVLHGVAQAIMDKRDEPWQWPEAGYRQRSLDEAKGSLVRTHFEEAYAEGMALSLADGIELALGR